MLRKLLWLMALGAVAGAWASADPVVDGRFDPNEGYTTGYYLDLWVQNYGYFPQGAQLWTYQNPTTHDVYVAFTQTKSLVDNTYGSTSVGWGSSAPSGKQHNFTDLVGSDKAQFAFEDALGNTVLRFDLDYISYSNGTYRSLGATGGDGRMLVGSSSNILEYGTSLDYNFNDLGYCLTTNSPATNSSYVENPSYPGWAFEVSYEVRVKGALFASGFGGARVPVVHDSPNKLGRNAIYPEQDGEIIPSNPPIPEPATALVFGAGAAVLVAIRRHKERKAAK